MVANEGRPQQNHPDTGDRALFERERERAAGRVADFSGVVREAGQKLGDASVMSRAADKLADSLARAGEYIQAVEPREVVRDVENFARRRPEAFLGGAFIAGAVLGRFLRSRPRDDADASDRGATQGESKEPQPTEQEVEHGA